MDQSVLYVKLWVVLKRTVGFGCKAQSACDDLNCLLGGGVLGDGLGTLRHSVLGQLTGQQKPDGGLDLAGGDSATLVVVSES